MTVSTSNTTLHERSSKSFNRTPNGLIFTDNLKVVYSIFLICLDLKENPNEHKKFFNFSKSYPFSFSLQDAVQKMNKLELQVDMNATSISISYSIKPELANYLIKIFMEAKLLHTPADRTRNEPKNKVLLQPTPKGIAILQKYIRDIGLKKIPKILLSNFNSMQLFTFERSSITDSIVHSDYLIHILFIKVMGPTPNIWLPTNSSDSLPKLSELLEYNNESFSFENMDYNSHFGFQGDISNRKSELSWYDQLADVDINDSTRVSPYAHKFFTNPDSDSHVQYYVSNKGVRLFQAKSFGRNKTIIDYCFTTKALWQWLMDCTDIIYPKEAVSVAALFLKKGLIVPILLPPSENSKRKFHISRSSYYTLSKIGWEIVQWNTESGIKKALGKFTKKSVVTPNSEHIDITFGKMSVADDKHSLDGSFDNDSDNLENNHQFDSKFNTLDDILRDPGMRFLFRRFLEKELCVENLDAHIEIKKFLKKMTQLKKLLESRTSNSNWPNKQRSLNNSIQKTIDSALTKLANECLEMTYHIYSTYIMIGAPYQLNIDHVLRESITAIMLNPQSPLSKSFNADFGSTTSLNDTNTDKIEEHLVLGQVNLEKPEPAVYKAFNGRSSSSSSFRDYKPSSLSLNIKSNGEPLTELKGNTFIVPENDELSTTLNILKNLFPLFDGVSEKMFKLMKIDSLPKFLKSDVYSEALASNAFHDKDPVK
ncbi:hypothetical protein Kpol_1013p53 [Vanderwaltozyma polyspora DSM 70294]|uniref:Protein SST2 n=1 Tax=Vanderwaltozyma polyspora (strain ATCC 22028 / DSM 70294 / BCRC 21397 / CBS 2163 / NBRC 10782 / NRRL Y-8283 / UCD 57-17) TaxID=436907 RepID=A7THA0_VANPO|nr:uncharacterized protein Kpol_1013p53 [Vanderwaltozyma polyspora DSM 70294]EDO18381.1 hypothetical protein Kpol_1013p53 [Vanderwaltozyma polyspora DSM 70294]